MPRMIPARLTRAYCKAINRQGAAAERSARAALRAYLEENPDATVADVRDFAIEVVMSAGELYGGACSQAAFELQDEIAYEFGAKHPDLKGWYYVPNIEQVTEAVHYKAAHLVDGEARTFVEEIAKAARYHAEQGANATMAQTARKQARTDKRRRRKGAERDGVRFARVPQGAEPCEFCRMLAARGFVYLSEESAGEFFEFHKGCTCKAVPGYWDAQLEGYVPES